MTPGSRPSPHGDTGIVLYCHVLVVLLRFETMQGKRLATVTLYSDGSILVMHPGTEMGQVGTGHQHSAADSASTDWRVNQIVTLRMLSAYWNMHHKTRLGHFTSIQTQYICCAIAQNVS